MITRNKKVFKGAMKLLSLIKLHQPEAEISWELLLSNIVTDISLITALVVVYASKYTHDIY